MNQGAEDNELPQGERSAFFENERERGSRQARIIYAPFPEASPETQVEVLARVFAFVIECHERKKAARAGDGERKSDRHRPEENAVRPREP